MEDQPHFWDIAAAAADLDIKADVLLKLATEQKIRMSIRVPPSMAVWRIVDQHLSTASSKCLISLEPSIKFISIEPETCRYLLKNTQWQLPATFMFAHAITAKGGLEPYNAALRMLPKWRNLHSEPESSVILPIRQGHTPGTTQLLGQLLLTQNGEPVNLTISREDLGIISTELQRYKDESLVLPPDKLIVNAHTTLFMIDLNKAARHMFALAQQNRNHYPINDKIIHFIRNLKSFADREANCNIDKYLDLVETSADVVKFHCVKRKGKRIIDPSRGYVSEDFQILMDAASLFNSLKIEGRNLQVKELVSFLKSRGMSENLAERCPPLILPDSS